MLLRTDEQTISDLGIFGSKGTGSIYELFHRVNSRGGAAVLEEMFRKPLSDRDAISRRISIIESFARSNIRFPYDAALMDAAEKYLTDRRQEAKNESGPAFMGEKEMQSGVGAILDIFQKTRAFVDLPEVRGIPALSRERADLCGLLDDPAFAPVFVERPGHRLSFSALTAYDSLFRLAEQDKIQQLLEYMYFLDVYISVARIARDMNFIFPTTLEKGRGELHLDGVYHPGIKAPVANSITMNGSRNVIFLSGANMAGKSTFLRSVSTALYLAHMGFPVPAKSMQFSVMDGIYTTINLPDNLGIGASHFYVEVLRVKKIASELSTGQSFFILFDELFRGTNVKDAHEATVAVASGFSRRKNSLFIISSHIVEAAKDLERTAGFAFHYLPTRMQGNVPVYTYKLEKGVTDDRHGMIIIKNEGILEILKNGNKVS
ncbi:DNA mismatch repair protein [Flavitalea sp. BT771]|uniref:MutS-related protein n=1 Tax=Flavitalea sp. BT771 TaxID=3063329 RepID=UPI0026E3E745|nr:DNA mismatch repair protein [Flavitalea sp. BT771]MDO6430068.1 DNA mismatch repair protein [Flavitalea sp. BT771]MDV6219793.1 DNA mismatch repair protein [Flavitalea sp. BT771]